MLVFAYRTPLHSQSMWTCAYANFLKTGPYWECVSAWEKELQTKDKLMVKSLKNKWMKGHGMMRWRASTPGLHF